MPKAPTETPPLSPIVNSVFDGFLNELEQSKVLDADALMRLKKVLTEDQESAAQPLRDAIFGTDGVGE
jgi:hypothetical protein